MNYKLAYNVYWPAERGLWIIILSIRAELIFTLQYEIPCIFPGPTDWFWSCWDYQRSSKCMFLVCLEKQCFEYLQLTQFVGTSKLCQLKIEQDTVLKMKGLNNWFFFHKNTLMSYFGQLLLHIPTISYDQPGLNLIKTCGLLNWEQNNHRKKYIE